MAKKISIQAEFELGELVHITNDVEDDKLLMQVIGYQITPLGLLYICSDPDGGNDTFYELQLTRVHE